MESRKQNKTKSRLSAAFPVLLLIAGFGLLCYPAVSNSLNLLWQQKEVENYLQKTGDMEEADRRDLLAEAEEYNSRLQALGAPLADYEELTEEYRRVLDVTGTGVMGYVTIPGIGVELPVCHGTDDEVLKKAAGHLEGSSLPIGGEGTHAVISAHRGLPGAKLFTELSEVKEGDLFSVTILGEERTYQVDQIAVVLPQEQELLNTVRGKEYVTLMTCTPYGINSHRLLVRGVRTEDTVHRTESPAEPEGLPADILIPLLGIPLLFVLLAAALFIYRKKPQKRKEKTTIENEMDNHRE